MDTHIHTNTHGSATVTLNAHMCMPRVNNKQTHFFLMNCDVGMMIDHDVPAKTYGNKVRMLSY